MEYSSGVVYRYFSIPKSKPSFFRLLIIHLFYLFTYLSIYLLLLLSLLLSFIIIIITNTTLIFIATIINFIS